MTDVLSRVPRTEFNLCRHLPKSSLGIYGKHDSLCRSLLPSPDEGISATFRLSRHHIRPLHPRLSAADKQLPLAPRHPTDDVWPVMVKQASD